MDLKNINDPGHWHIALAIAGSAITIAALAANIRPMALVGLGILAFGVGEMKNHPYTEELIRDEEGYLIGRIKGHPRRPSLLGLSLDAIGIMLFVSGLIWFVLGG